MQNDILRKFLHKHVIMVDILFLQQNQHNELDANTNMDIDMNSHPAQNDDTCELQSKNDHKGRETETAMTEGNSSNEINPEHPAYKKKEEWISSGKFFMKVMKKKNIKDNGKPVTKNK